MSEGQETAPYKTETIEVRGKEVEVRFSREAADDPTIVAKGFNAGISRVTLTGKSEEELLQDVREMIESALDNGSFAW